MKIGTFFMQKFSEEHKHPERLEFTFVGFRMKYLQIHKFSKTAHKLSIKLVT